MNKIFTLVLSIAAIVMIGVLGVAKIADASNGLQLGRDLCLGSGGEDVRSLQKFLNSNDYIVSAAGVGSPGYESAYFGYLTRAALIRFQAANGLSQTGCADASTRNILAGGNGTTNPSGTPNASTLQMIETIKARIAELQKQLAAIQAGDSNNNKNSDAPYITALKVTDGGDEGIIDIKDYITITFSEAIDPESINEDLDEDETVTDVTSSMNGGVSVSDDGKVTIKKIASFDLGSVDAGRNFTSKMKLDPTGKVLTITLTGGSDVDINKEDFNSVNQIGGTIEDKDGNAMESDEGIVEAAGTFGGSSDGNDDDDNDENPYIKSIAVKDGGNENYIDKGDEIIITFSEAIDPESINEDLDEGDNVTDVSYKEVGGVSVSSVGRVTIKGIAAFTAGEVTDSGSFDVKLALNSTGKILTITLTDGDKVSIDDEDFMAAAQIGGTIEDKDGDEMKADASISDPTGTFGGGSADGGPEIESIKVADDDSEGYISVGDTITINFSEEIDPESINEDLEAGSSVGGVAYSSIGGVTIASTGKVTIKGIASFDMGSVEEGGNFDVTLELDDDGEVLTVALEDGSDIEITDETFSAAAQIGGYIENEDGDEMQSDSSIDKPTGTFGGENEDDDEDEDDEDGDGPNIESIELDNGGDSGSLDEGDEITITFSEEIDPESVNDDLETGDEVDDVDSSDIGGVTLSSSGKLTVKGITTFTFAETDNSDSTKNYTVTLSLNDDGDELTIKITDGDEVEITDDDFSANTTQIGGYVENEDGDEMESDSSIDDPDGSF